MVRGHDCTMRLGIHDNSATYSLEVIVDWIETNDG